MHRFLIDECLSPALVTPAQNAGFQADHVVHMGWRGLKDWQLLPLIERHSYVFVTNNRVDFLKLHSSLQLHSGLVVIAPNVPLNEQLFPFERALERIVTLPDLINQALEIDGDIAGYTITIAALSDGSTAPIDRQPYERCGTTVILAIMPPSSCSRIWQ